MNSKYVDYKYVNGRCILAVPTRNDYQIISMDNTIAEIKIQEEPIFYVGEKIGLEEQDTKYNYKCNEIVALDDRSFLLKESGRNLCNSFILPIVLHPNVINDKMGLYNCYINEELSEFYVIFRFSSTKEYLALEERLVKLKSFIGQQDFKAGYVAFKFDMLQFKSLAKLFMDGKYSKLPSKVKTQIIDYNNGNQDIINILMLRECRRLELQKKIGMKLSKDNELKSKPTEIEYYTYFTKTILNNEIKEAR